MDDIVPISTTATLLAGRLLALLSPNARSDLALLVSTPSGLPVNTIADTTLDELRQVFGSLLLETAGDGRIALASPGLRRQLSQALTQSHAGPLADDPGSRIRAAIANGDLSNALSIFESEGGVFFAHVHGVTASQRIVNTFPESLRRASEVLRLAEAINAMKLGHIVHAKSLLVAVDPSARTLMSLCHAADTISLDLICCRMVVGVCDEEPIEQQVLTLLFRVLEKLPVDSSMRRGMLYNVALDAFVRLGHWEAAHETALQARFHFTNARAKLAAFYIELYLALIDLARGNIEGARATLSAADDLLANNATHSDNDRRLLLALQAICDYERGEGKVLTQLMDRQMEEGSFGELWPSIAGPLIAYGTRALVSLGSAAKARRYLERWRLQQWCSERFATSLALAEIERLQLGERWHAADQALSELSVAGRFGLGLMPSDTADMLRNEFQLCRTRAALHAGAADAGVHAALEGLLQAGSGLTARQHIVVLIWTASAAAARQDWTRLRSSVAELSDCVQSTGIVAVLIEQRSLLRRLFESTDVRRQLASSAKATGFLRTYARFGDPDVHAAIGQGLTRQEARILMLLVEDVPNKTIARRLDVALPTVRFHLKNVYRKLGCSRRDDVRLAARNLGLVRD